MTKLPERLDGAWLAILDIKDEPDFDELYVAIEVDVLDGLDGDERNTAIEALNAYLASIGKASRAGYV